MKVLLSAAAALVFPVAAFAADCPAGKTGVDVTPPGPSSPSGVTDNVISSIDLGAYNVEGRMLRLRRLVVQPNGVVPWHSHAERPAMIYIVSGEVVEYASSCAVPIVHRAGDVAPEKNGTSHWWKNTGKTTAVLISVDLFPGAAQMDEHVM